ncbi:MAG: biotin/lipoyl-containing protein, partial [Candidatus Eisenbacteria bacterium]
MSFEVKVPRLAESISEAVLVQWLKGDGEPVKVDEAIAVLETDKAAVELPAERAGVLEHRRRVGDKVEVGDVVAAIREDVSVGVTPATAAATPQATPVSRSGTARAAEPAASQSAPAYGAGEADAADGERAALSPAVRRLVDEHGLDPAVIPATGRGGRLLKEDVERHLLAHPSAPVSGAASPATATRTPPPSAATPGAGTRTPPAPAAPAPTSPVSVPGAPIVPATPAASTGDGAAVRPGGAPGSDWREGETERQVPMSRVRQRIAERLVEAQHTA